MAENNDSPHQEENNSTGTLSNLYMQMETDKSSILGRAETYARWTLPTVLTEDSDKGNDEKQHDFQSIGARAVNHLSNKLAFALFAPARPFFKLEASTEFLAKLEENNGLNEIAVQTILSKAEQIAMRRFVTWRSRTAAIFALKSIIITGNSLMYFPNDGKAQTYNFRDYVVKRDLSGKVIDLITRDRKKVGTLPDAIRTAVLANKEKNRTDDTDADLYTRVKFIPETKKYHVFQAVDELPLDTVGTYPEDELPWIPLTWDLQRGADYGTGLVEDYAGDFHALSTLTFSIVTNAAIAADIKFLVDPTGNTDYVALNNAKSGDYIPGKKEDIEAFSLSEKQADWNFVSTLITQYEKRIGLAFLLGSAVTRDAERVTAEEIRFQAQELETGLGGQYSRLAEEFQLPMSHILLKDIDFSISGDDIVPIIVTGLESLSRNSEVEKVLLFLQDMSLIANLPETVQEFVKVPELAAIFGAARSVDYQLFMFTQEEVNSERERKQQALLDAQNSDEQNTARNNAAEQNMIKD